MLRINCKIIGSLCKDYEYEITDKKELAENISQLIIGNAFHVSRALRGMDPRYRVADKEIIESSIKRLELRGRSDIDMCKVDGWLFQMMSWLALAKQHVGDIFFQEAPHSQPSKHGIDGLAIKLNADNSIDRIIITEDKCTENAYSTVHTKIYPELVEFENGDKNNAIFQQVEALISTRLGEQFFEIQDDIVKSKYRQYRIGITRQLKDNSDDGRSKLYSNYDKKVTGTDIERRTASSIFLNDQERQWMEELDNMVIDRLQSYLN